MTDYKQNSSGQNSSRQNASSSKIVLTPQRLINAIREVRPLPVAVQKLYGLVGDLDSKIQDVSRAIASDEVLSSKILQIANSAFYGFSHHIGSIPQAVAVIGFHGIRSLALSITVAQFGAGIQGKTYREKIWRETFLIASAAKLIAVQQRLKAPEEAFAAGILHNIGQLLLLQNYPEQYEAVLEKALLLEKTPFGNRSLSSLEFSAFQMNHAEIGAMIVKQWNLPFYLVYAVGEHHQPLNETYPPAEAEQLSFILKRAVLLIKYAAQCEAQETGKTLEEIAEGWIEPAALQDILERLPGEMKNIEIFLNMK